MQCALSELEYTYFLCAFCELEYIPFLISLYKSLQISQNEQPSPGLGWSNIKMAGSLVLPFLLSAKDDFRNGNIKF